MIKLSKKISIVYMILVISLVGGFSNNGSPKNPETPDKVQTEGNTEMPNLKFSNINDASSQDKVYNLLSEVGIGEHNLDMFKKSVTNYYKSVEGVELINPDEKLSDLQVPYNIYDLSDRWIEKNPDFSDQNCRLTSFRLFNKFVDSESNESYKKMDTDVLVFDLNAIKFNPNAKYSEEDTNKFSNLFSSIPVTDANNLEESAKEITKTIKERKISFKSTDKISLISGYVPGLDDNSLFVGHTGVLINTNEGFVFIEKYGFEQPYQVTLFKDKKEVKNYLFDRLKTSFTGEKQDYTPIIMENNKLM